MSVLWWMVFALGWLLVGAGIGVLIERNRDRIERWASRGGDQ